MPGYFCLGFLNRFLGLTGNLVGKLLRAHRPPRQRHRQPVAAARERGRNGQPMPPRVSFGSLVLRLIPK